MGHKMCKICRQNRNIEQTYTLIGRSRLLHLPSGTPCHHQPDPLTLLVLLNLDLKRICLHQHTLPSMVQRYRSASDSHATRALQKFALTMTLT